MDWSKLRALCHVTIMLLALIICLTCSVISLKALKYIQKEDSKDLTKGDCGAFVNNTQKSEIHLTTETSPTNTGIHNYS